MGEDRHFTYCCYAFANLIWEIPNMLYHYCENSQSASNFDYSEKKIDDDAKSIKLTETFMNKNGINKFDKSITETKIYIKSCYIFKLKKPNIKKYRKTFPEVTIKALFVKRISVIINWCAFLHLDFLIKFIIRFWQ